MDKPPGTAFPCCHDPQVADLQVFWPDIPAFLYVDRGLTKTHFCVKPGGCVAEALRIARSGKGDRIHHQPDVEHPPREHPVPTP